MPRIYNLALVMIAIAITPTIVLSQTDEIQVYDAEIATPGTLNLMIHTNFTPIGRTQPAYPNAIVADRSVNGAAEWAYGVTPWFEQGLYLPVYSLYSSNRGATINGFKVRELFVRPHAQDHKFVYGINFEFSVNALYWEPRRISSEIRPIVGMHLGHWDFLYNPIFDTDYRGGLGGMQFNPAGRVAYRINQTWAVALEQYDGYGQVNDLAPPRQQFHETWAVVDRNVKTISVETGVGVGWNKGSDRLTLKLMLSRNLKSNVR